MAMVRHIDVMTRANTEPLRVKFCNVVQCRTFSFCPSVCPLLTILKRSASNLLQHVK